MCTFVLKVKNLTQLQKKMVQCSRVILYPVMNIIHYEFQFILQNAYYTDNKVNELFSVRKGKN